jgi:sterol desaturase/sphingolipid hydroxylase (fatty acid hydroxylase superfamily)
MKEGNGEKLLLEDIREQNPRKSPDEKSLAEKKAYDHAFKDAKLREITQNIDERKSYAKKLFILISSWLFGVFLLLVFSGVKSIPLLGGFSLSDSVLIAILTSTTLNILGIFAFVTKYLYWTPGGNHRFGRRRRH